MSTTFEPATDAVDHLDAEMIRMIQTLDRLADQACNMARHVRVFVNSAPLHDSAALFRSVEAALDIASKRLRALAALNGVVAPQPPASRYTNAEREHLFAQIQSLQRYTVKQGS